LRRGYKVGDRVSAEFSVADIDEVTKSFLKIAEKTKPKEMKKFMNKEGGKLKSRTMSKAKRTVKRKTGNYLKGIKKGRVYKYLGDELAIRVYNSMPHAHLIEDGHRQLTKSGKEVGFVRGTRVFKMTRDEFEKVFTDDIIKFVDGTFNL